MAKAKKAKKTKVTPQNKRAILIAKVVGVILLVPLLGNLFSEGWSWGVADFVIMGTLLFGTGMAIDYAVRKVTSPTYRALAILGILAILFAIWIELAVDGVSQALALV